MGVKTYDPSKVIITYGGTPISGFADGSFVTITPATERWTKVTGADGEVARGKSNDYTHEVQITLLQTSLSNAYLSTILASDRLLNDGVKALQILDLSGTSIFFWPEAWIKQEPDVDYAKEIGERQWTFDTGQASEVIIGGNV